MRANNNKGGEFVRKTGNPIVNINGDNNSVEVKVTYTKTLPNVPTTIVIVSIIIVVAFVLAVLHCCPELFAEFVRSIISIISGN